MAHTILNANPNSERVERILNKELSCSITAIKKRIVHGNCDKFIAGFEYALSTLVAKVCSNGT